MAIPDLMKECKECFETVEGAKVYFAPGRVNLIGEHTDYNGGTVFPCALTIGTYAIARRRNDDVIRMYSMNFPDEGVYETTLSMLYKKTEDSWTNYPKGMIYTLIQGGYGIEQGMDLFFYGNIPHSSGLSSSASIEVLVGYICMDLFGLDYDMVDLAMICQHSENRYNGVKCGIMDQFAIAMGKKNKGIYLDTNTLKYQYVDVPLHDCKIVIMNTNKKRGLGDSKYNERREECEQALQIVQKSKAVASLGELQEEEIFELESQFENPVLYQRARHAVLENVRTKRAVEAFEKGDLVAFGELMNQSHKSLRDDYEVTGKELDTLVENAWNQEGVLGARMTGAGFGGCAIALVRKSSIPSFVEKVGAEYRQIIGYDADFYTVEIGDGPRIL